MRKNSVIWPYITEFFRNKWWKLRNNCEKFCVGRGKTVGFNGEGFFLPLPLYIHYQIQNSPGAAFCISRSDSSSGRRLLAKSICRLPLSSWKEKSNVQYRTLIRTTQWSLVILCHYLSTFTWICIFINTNILNI